MTTRARLTVYAALATALAMMGLSPLLRPSGWILPACLQITVVALVGAGLRRLSIARPLVPPTQLVVVLYLLIFGSVRTSLSFGLLPGPQALRDFGQLLNGALDDIHNYAIPAPATASLRLVLVGSVALVAIVVDALAVTYRRAALAGLPLLALYSVGTGLAGSDNGALWLWFLLAGAGYLMLLFAEGRDRLSRWGRVFRGNGAGANRGDLSTGGHLIGILALSCAVVLGGLAPAWDGLNLVNGGFGDGGGGGRGGGISALNPVVSLTDGLRRPENQVLITYTGDDPALKTTYLRTTALDEFNGVEWKPGSQSTQPLSNPLPYPDGPSDAISSPGMTTRIAISNGLSSQWLPMPFPARQAELKGDWRFEPETGSVIGAQGQKAGGMRYTVTSLNVDPTADQLRRAGPVPPPILEKYTKVPANLPSVVRETALKVTAGHPTVYDKAVALQDWFTTTGGFLYSPSVDPGTGPDAIAKFLQDKRGFCVHFAATYAAMARELGIPARVAVGFAPGDDLGDGNYQVGSKDYHAWPELYFAGAGWLRFEPTPSRGTTPDYGGTAVAPTPTATAMPSATPTDQGSSQPSADTSCAPILRRQGGCADQQQDAPVAVAPVSSGTSWQLLAVLAAAGLVLLLLLSPMAWRWRLRRRRLGGGRRRPGGPGGGELTEAQVLAAWQELIDTAWDLGIPPDEALSPRHTVRRISEAGALDERGRAAVGRVALATERVLYAREAGPTAPLGPDLRTARDGLRASAKRGQRLRAVLLPPSTVRLAWRTGDAVRGLRHRIGAALRRAGERLTGPLRRAGRGLRR
ncbi:transglutaminase family protein [Kitasatospora azatica]|uniref:transglutaminase family protein n=1 Tax=Kitasatospora azatica TaxID=58347 RepID=UPI0005645600|nr:DUF3488 and transglutaminase-like domain-containing protein [Kitasatospora azatica]